MEREKKNKNSNSKVKKDSNNGVFAGMLLGTAITIGAESAALGLTSSVISDMYTSAISGKAMEEDNFDNLQAEYKTLQNAYNYYSNGGNSEYYIKDFDYSLIRNQYYKVESAGIKTYLKACLDKKIIDYIKANPDTESLDINQLYEEVLWEIVSTSIEEGAEEKTLEDYLNDYYSTTTGSYYMNYHNLELDNQEEQAVEFVKKY